MVGSPAIALIATVRDEEQDIWKFLESIERQTLQPDVVVITVARESRDKTAELVRTFAKKSKSNIRWFWTEINRSVGRNDAVFFATQELEALGLPKYRDYIIACTNVCVLRKTWVDEITFPIREAIDIRIGPVIDIVGGSYRIAARNRRERAAGLVTQYTPAEIEGKQFVTALSMAFTKRAFDQVGGFPELLDTSEDTVFVQKLRAAGFRFAYAPLAIVEWRPSTLTLRGAYRTYQKFATTDRKANINRATYWATWAVYTVSLFLFAFDQTLFGVVLLTSWFVWRARKSALGLPYAIAVDLGRIRGYFFR